MTHVQNKSIENQYIEACRKDDLTTVKNILNSQYFKNYPKQQFFLEQGLISAARYSLDIVEYLTTSPELSIHADPNTGEGHALRMASMANKDVVEFLTTSPKLKTHPQFTYYGEDNEHDCFLIALAEGPIEIVKFYLESEKLLPHPSLSLKYEYRGNALDIACNAGNLPVIKYLLEEKGLKDEPSVDLSSSDYLLKFDRRGYNRNVVYADIIDYFCFSPTLEKHADLSVIKEMLAYKAAKIGDLNVLKYLYKKFGNEDRKSVV